MREVANIVTWRDRLDCFKGYERDCHPELDINGGARLLRDRMDMLPNYVSKKIDGSAPGWSSLAVIRYSSSLWRALVDPSQELWNILPLRPRP